MLDTEIIRKRISSALNSRNILIIQLRSGQRFRVMKDVEAERELASVFLNLLTEQIAAQSENSGQMHQISSNRVDGLMKEMIFTDNLKGTVYDHLIHLSKDQKQALLVDMESLPSIMVEDCRYVSLRDVKNTIEKGYALV